MIQAALAPQHEPKAIGDRQAEPDPLQIAVLFTVYRVARLAGPERAR